MWRASCWGGTPFAPEYLLLCPVEMRPPNQCGGRLRCRSQQGPWGQLGQEPSGSPQTQPPRLPGPSSSPCAGSQHLLLGSCCPLVVSCLLGPPAWPPDCCLLVSLRHATGHGDGCHHQLADLCLIRVPGLPGSAALGPRAGPPAPHRHRQCLDSQQL